MGSKYPSLKSSEVVNRLRKHGFVFVSQSGSHAKYARRAENMPMRTAIVPMHSEVAKGTLSKILRQAGLSVEEFMGKP